MIFATLGMDDVAKMFGNKRVGLALSGGGARGFAHVGVLMAMEELGIVPDVIAGVSAGSIVAVLYASGMKAADIAKAFGEMSMGDLTEIAIPKNGFFKLTGLKDFLKKRIPVARIEELPMRAIVCATDFDNCRPVAFEEGPIGDCVAASCSIPIVFQPVKINGTTYVDGGVMRNLPAWAGCARQMRRAVGGECKPHARHKIPQHAYRHRLTVIRHNVAQQCQRRHRNVRHYDTDTRHKRTERF